MWPSGGRPGSSWRSCSSPSSGATRTRSRSPGCSSGRPSPFTSGSSSRARRRRKRDGSACSSGRGAGSPWDPRILWTAADGDWGQVAGQWPNLVALVVVAVLGLLLNASGIELIAHRDADLNRELRAAGAADAIAGLMGGAPGYHALSLTALAGRMGAPVAATGAVAAAGCAAVLALGSRAMTFVPTAVLGGLLFFLGISLLHEWLYEAWWRLPRSDYVVVALIVGAVATQGFLVGFGLGLALTLVLFVVNYSRTDPIKHQMDGTVYRSRVERSEGERDVLRDHGSSILVLEMQGFVFFGTATSLLDRVYERAKDRARPLRSVVIDLRRVTGVDSSSVQTFLKLRRMAETDSVRIVLTGLGSTVRRQLERGGMDAGGCVLYLPDVDRALELCEDDILRSHVPDGGTDAVPDPLRSLLDGLDPELVLRY
ncbi:MAG TPA: SulP family inorganic anion transporter, partial [Actinomycetota bacterium]|nr:SulP family inorganic anion transporter [Actinomycetota bacterium]